MIKNYLIGNVDPKNGDQLGLSFLMNGFEMSCVADPANN